MCDRVFSKFDLPILLPSIVTFAKSEGLNTPRALKRLTKIINLMISEPLETETPGLPYVQNESNQLISFRDVLSYTSPCSLTKFLSQWKTSQKKGFFPHG